ncbi:MAG TPA: hypothetical protein VHZ04_03425 [Candidatus Paceibacterota bacterium]|jgi:hypothetical protein|nr:hypothetical protein [Candidatus Paceibacterota bacterium]
MKRKFLIIGLPIIGGLALAGVSIASAAGMFGGGMAAGPMMGPGGFAGLGGGVSAVSPTDWASNQTAQFNAEASALNLPVSTIVSGWAAGESMEQIATANGISQTQYQTDMKNYAQSEESADLQALVSAGTITQAQMTQYQQAQATAQANLQTKMQNASGTWSGGPGGRGFGKMRTSSSTPTATPTPS